MEIPKKQKRVGKCYHCGNKGTYFHIYDNDMKSLGWACKRHACYWGGMLPEPMWNNEELD